MRDMNEGGLQLWPGVLFRQRADFTLEFISPHVGQWTGLEPHRALEAIHPADRSKAQAERARFRLRHARTWQITWVEQRRRPVDGGFEGYWEDVTDQVRLQHELADAHWKATLGTATQRLVHDFNNLLTGILSLSDAYLLRAGSSAQEGLQLINQNARQAADLVQHIGALFREVPGRRSYQNLTDLAGAAAEMLRRLLPKHSTVKFGAKQESIPVFLDPVEAKRVIVSLGLALVPPISVEVLLEHQQAELRVSGAAREDSRALLVAENFAERNDARFSADANDYTLRFAEADFSEAGRQTRSLLLIGDESKLALAEVLRRHGHQVVIGPKELRGSADYRFDAVVGVADGSLLPEADVVFTVGMSEEEMLAKLREAF